MSDPALDPDLIGFLDDRTLIVAYQRIHQEPADPSADALLAEIERRGLHA